MLASETQKFKAKVDSSWDWLLDKSEYTRIITLINEDGSFRTQYDRFFDRLKTPVGYDSVGRPHYMDSKKLVEQIRALYNGSDSFLNKEEIKQKIYNFESNDGEV